MTTKTLTKNASIYGKDGYLIASGLTVQTCTGDANICDTVIIGSCEHPADDVEIGDGEITMLLSGARVVWDVDAEPTAKLVLDCTKTQKGSYVRAAAGRKLVDWCLEQLDVAARQQQLAAAADLALEQQSAHLDDALCDLPDGILDDLARAADYSSQREVANDHDLWGRTVREAIEYLRYC